MRTVRDASGQVYLLLKESGASSRVRNPETGEERYVANDELEPVAGESPLVTASRAVPESVRTLITATRDERALGLLVELVERGPLSARRLLDATDLCESDLYGLMVEFKLAGLVEEAAADGERGYAATEAAAEALAAVTPS